MISIDLDHAGLLCRAAPSCRRVFHPRSQSSEADLAASAAERDRHEQDVHGYAHARVPDRAFSFADYHAQKRRTARASGTDRISFR